MQQSVSGVTLLFYYPLLNVLVIKSAKIIKVCSLLLC